MALKKRLTTFVSNWLGVIIAIIIVLLSATFGGGYLYARSRADFTLSFVTQDITLRWPDGLVKTGTIETPPGYIFHLVLQLQNPTADAADVTVTDIKIIMDTYTLTVSQNGSWNKTVTKDSGGGTGYDYFEGDLTIDSDTFAALVDKGAVDVDIRGTISAFAQYKWVKRHETRDFNIHIPLVKFELTP